MAKLYEYNRIYGIVKRFVIFTFRQYYGEFVINGKENIPAGGPVIYTSNHTNALMDPLAIMSVVPPRTPVVYLARSDYFHNRWIRKLMLYFKILPAFRIREGIGNVDKNYEVFNRCLEVLLHNKPVGIMPEGSQGFTKQIRQLVKGTFRIAFAAQQTYGLQPGVKIVPIGIDLEDFEKFGKRIIINIGKPIEVADFMPDYQKNPAIGLNRLREKLRQDLIDLTLHIPSQRYYDTIETAAEVANESISRLFNVLNDTISRFKVKQKIASHLLDLENRRPDVVMQLEKTCNDYRRQLLKLHLPNWVFDQPNGISRLKMSGLVVALMITFPVFFPGLLVNMMPFFGPDLLIKLFKLHLPGGLSSLRFGLGILIFPLAYFIQAWLIYKKFELSIWQFLILLPLQFILGKFAFRWYQYFQRVGMMLRFKHLQRRSSEGFNQTVELHNEICRLVMSA